MSGILFLYAAAAVRDVISVMDKEESFGIANGWRFALINEGIQHTV
jgi:hypothetical protein